MGPYVHVAALEHDHAIAIKWAWLQLHDCFFCAETWHKTIAIGLRSNCLKLISIDLPLLIARHI